MLPGGGCFRAAQEYSSSSALARRDGPLVVLLRTVKGRGVSFMEGRMEWHYLPLNESQYQLAIRELTEI